MHPSRGEILVFSDAWDELQLNILLEQSGEEQMGVVEMEDSL